MATGRWSVTLRRDTPASVLNALDMNIFGFGHVVITSARVDYRILTDAQILNVARFSGIYRERPDDYTIGGPTANAWLGDEDNKGPVIEGTLSVGSPYSFGQWRVALTPSFLDISTASTPLGGYNRTFTRCSYRDAIDEISDRFGTEWIVRPNFTLDWAHEDELFVTTPQSIIVPRLGTGRDTPYRVLVGSMNHEQSLEDWTRTVHYFTGTEDAPTLATATIAGTVPYRAPDGTPIVMERIMEDFSGSIDPSNLAAAQLGRFDHVKESMTLSALDYDIGDAVRVGDHVWVFDYERGIYNRNNPRPYRGGWTYPLGFKVVGHTWPIRSGMGVYFRRFQPGQSEPTFVADYIDLTPYVVWEPGAAELEVGDPRNSFIYRNRLGV